jgi:glycerophosphoryl diester phosphodiesterase
MTPLIIGHRGASAAAPENTMAAFREAIAVGADGIEFDVRLTRDGVPVVIHDRSLHRTARLPHRIADLTWSELQQVDQTVPSLDELLTLFESNNLLMYLELKCDSPAQRVPLAEASCKLINKHSLKERVIVGCFDLPALKVVRTIDPEIKTAASFELSVSTASPLSDQRILDQAAAVEASALALYHRLARKRLVEKAKQAGLWVAVWTVDNNAWVERARALGIDALITNDPAAMLAAR